MRGFEVFERVGEDKGLVDSASVVETGCEDSAEGEDLLGQWCTPGGFEDAGEQLEACVVCGRSDGEVVKVGAERLGGDIEGSSAAGQAAVECLVAEVPSQGDGWRCGVADDGAWEIAYLVANEGSAGRGADVGEALKCGRCVLLVPGLVGR